MIFNLFICLLLVVVVSSMPSDIREMQQNFKSPQMVQGSKPPGTPNCSINLYVLAIEYMCGFPSIHGLWPDPEQSCDTCTSEVFDESKLSPTTLENLKKNWPTCKEGGTNEEFWSHEWSKHGTCTGMSQEDFFTLVLNMFGKYQANCTSDCKLCFDSNLNYQGVCPPTI